MKLFNTSRGRRRNLLAGLLAAAVLCSTCCMPVMAEEVAENEETFEIAAVSQGSASHDSASSNTSGNKAKKNADGSWSYTVSQQEALSIAPKPEIYFDLEKTDSDLSLNLYARDAISYNRSKKALQDALVDISKSTASINGTYVKISKVCIKNHRRCYVSPDSIFAELISGNNLEAYSEIEESKRPSFYVKLDTTSAPLDVKKAAREANKEMKKNPIPIEMLPVDLTPYNVYVEYSIFRGKIKRLMVYDEDDKLTKLRFSSKEKKDFTYSSYERQIYITGTNNYNSTVVYDPSMCLSFY